MNARRASILLIALAVAAMVAQILRTSAERLYPRYDEVAYLALSRDFAHEGGPAAIVRCHLEGRCTEANRPPLYQFFLAPVVGDEPRDFANIKLVQHGMALLMVAMVLLVASRVFSPPVGIGSAIVVSLLSYMPEYGARIMHDLLFVALTFAAVYAIAAWQDRGPALWLVVGALVGLAFLTKGSGHLLFGPLMIASFYRHRWAVLRRPLLYLAVAGFLATSFFLLWRNLRLFGSPFYNTNAAWMWLDKWQEYWSLRLTPEYKTIGLGWYLQRHSIGALLLSIVKGFGFYVGVTIYTAGFGFANPIARGVIGFGLLVLAGFGVRRRWRAGHRVEVVAVLSTIAVYYPALSLTAKAASQAHPRYALPYIVLLIPYAVLEALERFWPWLRGRIATRLPRLDPTRVAVGTLAAILLIRFALAAPAAFARNPRNLYEVDPRWHETSVWFAQNLVHGERFAMPYQSYYSTWDAARPDTDPRLPFVYMTPAPTMLGLLGQEKIRKVFVDRDEADFKNYQDKFSAGADAHGPLAFLAWPRCFADSGTPSRFLVFCQP